MGIELEHELERETTAPIPAPDAEMSADAKDTARQLQAAGYRGFALLRDPAAGLLIVYASASVGCFGVAVADIAAEPGEDPIIVPMPGLRIAPDANSKQIFEAVELELRKATSWTVH